MLVKIDLRGGPRRSRSVPGLGFGKKSQESRAKIQSQTAFRYPATERLLDQAPRLVALLDKACRLACDWAELPALTRHRSRSFASSRCSANVCLETEEPSWVSSPTPCPSACLKVTDVESQSSRYLNCPARQDGGKNVHKTPKQKTNRVQRRRNRRMRQAWTSLWAQAARHCEAASCQMLLTRPDGVV